MHQVTMNQPNPTEFSEPTSVECALYPTWKFQAVTFPWGTGILPGESLGGVGVTPYPMHHLCHTTVPKRLLSSSSLSSPTSCFPDSIRTEKRTWDKNRGNNKNKNLTSTQSYSSFHPSKWGRG